MKKVHKMTPLEAPYVNNKHEDMFLYYADTIIARNRKVEHINKIAKDLQEAKEPYIEGDNGEIITNY